LKKIYDRGMNTTNVIFLSARCYVHWQHCLNIIISPNLSLTFWFCGHSWMSVVVLFSENRLCKCIVQVRCKLRHHMVGYFLLHLHFFLFFNILTLVLSLHVVQLIKIRKFLNQITISQSKTDVNLEAMYSIGIH